MPLSCGQNNIPGFRKTFIDIHVGSEEHKTYLTKEAIVVPNPSSDFTFAFHGKPASNLLIFVRNGQAQEIIPVRYDASRNVSIADIDMKGYATGAYACKVMTENGVVSGKILNNNTFPARGNLEAVSFIVFVCAVDDVISWRRIIPLPAVALLVEPS